jgi:hypothetical protein
VLSNSTTPGTNTTSATATLSQRHTPPPIWETPTRRRSLNARPGTALTHRHETPKVLAASAATHRA